MQTLRTWIETRRVKTHPTYNRFRIYHRSMVEVRCPACGAVRIGRPFKIKLLKSCGCRMGHVVHRLSTGRLYRVWAGMRRRCYNKNDAAYSAYGARGIRICQSWLSYYQKFHDWAMSHGWSQGLSIERRNNNGNYSPRNCTFIPRSLQARNRRPNKLNETKVKGIRMRYQAGERQCDLAKEFKVAPRTMCSIVHNLIWKGV